MLVESTDIKIDAFRSLYEEYGAEVVEKVLAHHAEHEGISRVEKILHCHRRHLGIELGEAALNEICARYSALVEDAVITCAWVAGAREFLEHHQGRLEMFVVTGTPEDEIKRIAEARGMTRLFTEIHGSPRRKEAIVEDVLAARDYGPEESLFVGDAMTDWRAAAASGIRFIGRVGSFRDSPFPDGTRIVPDLTGLAAELDSL